MNKTFFFETDENVRLEGRVSDDLKNRWDCWFVKLDPIEGIDWHMERHKQVVAVGEFKGREIFSSQYDTFIISKRKYDMGMASSRFNGVPFLVVANYNDGLFYCVMNDKPVEFKMGIKEMDAHVSCKHLIKIWQP